MSRSNTFTPDENPLVLKGYSLEMYAPLPDRDYWLVVVISPKGEQVERKFKMPPKLTRTFSVGTLRAWLYNDFPHELVQENWPTIQSKWTHLVQLYIEEHEHP